MKRLFSKIGMKAIRLNQPEVVLAYTTDWHLSDVPPGRRAATYASEVLGKIRFAGEVAHRYGGVTICGGDVFHSKNARSSGNTFALANRLIDDLRKHPLGRVFGCHGNHDLWMDSTASIPAQPLGNLIAAGVFEDLSGGSIIFENQDASVRVQVDAFPYADDMVTLERVLNSPPREEGVTSRIILMHQYGNPGSQGSLFGHPTIGYDQMAACDYDLALWGHDHSRAEMVKVGNCTHVRYGSLSRASIAQDEVDRPVALALVTFTSQGRFTVEEINVPVRPLEIAFTQANREVERVQQSEEVERFFKEMDVAVETIESTDPRDTLRQFCPVGEPAVYDLAVELCGL
jgi:DNA repair exonuclease SbcCD nuclease subunit